MQPTPVDQDVARLGEGMLQFVCGIDKLDTPDDVLDALHGITSKACKINVMGAGLFPVRSQDLNSIEKGKTVFIHKSVPEGWWEEWLELSRSHPAPGLMLARLSLAPFTKSELMQRLEPLGIDRWPIELAMKYGIRNSLTCPVGGRWVVIFWSPHSLSQRFSEELRAILFMGATFAAIRLQKLVGSQPGRIGKSAALTPRELAVLRLMSLGHQVRETAQLLELGEETVRSHLKKAQVKLGVQNRSHAVAQAIRLHLIP